MNKKPAKTSNNPIPARLNTTICEKIAFPENKAIFTKKIIAVAAMSPMITGLTPFKAPWTNLFFKNFDKIMATKMMIMSDGNMTPRVEQTAPKIPAV